MTVFLHGKVIRYCGRSITTMALHLCALVAKLSLCKDLWQNTQIEVFQKLFVLRFKE